MLDDTIKGLDTVDDPTICGLVFTDFLCESYENIWRKMQLLKLSYVYLILCGICIVAYPGETFIFFGTDWLFP